MTYEEEKLYKLWLEKEKSYDFTLKSNEYSWLTAYERQIRINNIDTIKIMLQEGQEESNTIEDLMENDYSDYVKYKTVKEAKEASFLFP